MEREKQVDVIAAKYKTPYNVMSHSEHCRQERHQGAAVSVLLPCPFRHYLCSLLDWRAGPGVSWPLTETDDKGEVLSREREAAP